MSKAHAALQLSQLLHWRPPHNSCCRRSSTPGGHSVKVTLHQDKIRITLVPASQADKAKALVAGLVLYFTVLPAVRPGSPPRNQPSTAVGVAKHSGRHRMQVYRNQKLTRHAAPTGSSALRRTKRKPCQPIQAVLSKAQYEQFHSKGVRNLI